MAIGMNTIKSIAIARKTCLTLIGTVGVDAIYTILHFQIIFAKILLIIKQIY